ncbi:hypothetical protein GCM10023322_61530 [Rugosimonospora acidiphila]|uniref:Uncharacterized protein n=1 Tax=Rugosimonospora acidiphila TaxID=556531 RepID=A0ABP9SH85_9ACTN
MKTSLSPSPRSNTAPTPTGPADLTDHSCLPDGEHCHQQYLSDAKNPNGYCNHGPNGMTRPVDVARI